MSARPFFTQRPASPILPRVDPIEEEAAYWREWEANRRHDGRPLGELVLIVVSVVTTVGLVVALAAGWLP